MFTGIIQEVGGVKEVRKQGGGMRITVASPLLAPQLHADDSICLAGVCQTVIAGDKETFTVEAVEETLRKTTLGDLRAGGRVNLEPALRLSDRLGGHLVQGHVDGVGVVAAVTPEETGTLVSVRFPAEFRRYVIPVGSIAIDGVSLTVAAVGDDALTVAIIPHTMRHTTISDLRAGSRVNLEFDVLGKYVEQMLRGYAGVKGGLTEEKLKAWGWG